MMSSYSDQWLFVPICSTEAESDRPLFYLAAAYGPHGIKYEVKKVEARNQISGVCQIEIECVASGFSVNISSPVYSSAKINPVIHAMIPVEFFAFMRFIKKSQFIMDFIIPLGK
jgi:hypothetical protein